MGAYEHGAAFRQSPYPLQVYDFETFAGKTPELGRVVDHCAEGIEPAAFGEYLLGLVHRAHDPVAEARIGIYLADSRARIHICC